MLCAVIGCLCDLFPAPPRGSGSLGVVCAALEERLEHEYSPTLKRSSPDHPYANGAQLPSRPAGVLLRHHKVPQVHREPFHKGQA